MYNTSLPVIFGIPKYAQELMKICKSRNINVNLQRTLVEVDPIKRRATFECGDTKERIPIEYQFLHVGPPCRPPPCLQGSGLEDASGFVDVNPATMQHRQHPNVFAIGDCTNAPTAKTAAAVAAQSGVLQKTMNEVFQGKTPSGQYNGYTSCPLITSKNTCMLAEFGYDGKILETFPINQARESRLMYHLKANMMPRLYFDYLIRGKWNGPGMIRKLLHLGFTK